MPGPDATIRDHEVRTIAAMIFDQATDSPRCLVKALSESSFSLPNDRTELIFEHAILLLFILQEYSNDYVEEDRVNEVVGEVGDEVTRLFQQSFAANKADGRLIADRLIDLSRERFRHYEGVPFLLETPLEDRVSIVRFDQVDETLFGLFAEHIVSAVDLDNSPDGEDVRLRIWIHALERAESWCACFMPILRMIERRGAYAPAGDPTRRVRPESIDS